MAQTKPEFIELPSGESWKDSTSGGRWARLSGRRSKALKQLDGALKGYAETCAVAKSAYENLVSRQSACGVCGSDASRSCHERGDRFRARLRQG